MFFSPPTQHALRALIYLARRADARPVLARDIAAAEGIPAAFLSKILLRLRAAGLLRSTMGPGGGYALARPAGAIRIGEIADLFDDLSLRSTRCILRAEPCDEKASCPLHERWKCFVREFADGIGKMTLAEVASPVVAAEREGGRTRRSTRRSHAS